MNCADPQRCQPVSGKARIDHLVGNGQIGRGWDSGMAGSWISPRLRGGGSGVMGMDV